MKSLLSTTKSKIKNFFTYIWTNKKKPKVFISVIILLAILGFSAMPSAGADKYELKEVVAGDFVQEVAVTGKVTPAEKVDLSFEVGGRVSAIRTTVGKAVKKGDVLASISNADYIASLQQSQATYLSEQARLAEIKRGSRPEELAIANSDAITAQQNIDQAKLQLVEEIKDAYSKSEDAVRNKADKVFANAGSSRPELTFYVSRNPALKSSLENQRLVISEEFIKWQKLIVALDPATISDAQVAKGKSYLSLVQKFLNDLNVAVSSTNESQTQDATFQLYRNDIALARTNVNTAFQELNNASITLKNNIAAKVRADQQYDLKKSGSTVEEIAAQRAQAQGAAAGVGSASASLSKTMIRAPFDGIVTRIEYSAGESVTPSDAVITLMSASAFEIETYVSENEVPKLKIGQPAKVTLDALGDAIVFEAIISSIDLSETIKDGVVTYKTRLQFVSKDERIKSGLTANVIVETDRRSGIMKVPQSAIVIVKGKKNVKVAPAGSATWSQAIEKQAKIVPVSTGGIDREGDIEVTDGLTAGEKIIVRSSVE